MASTRRTTDYRIDPFDLHLYTAVLEHGSITAAATAANLSLAAASARLKSLESTVGARLLERSKAGAVPTDAGRALARHAHRILTDLEALHGEMAAYGQGLRGTLRVLCNTAAMCEALPPRLGPFLMQHPALDVDVQELPSDAVVDGLHRGSGDLGIVADHVDTAGLVVRPWLSDPLAALLPRAWVPRGRRSLAYADLLDRPFVGLSLDSGLARFLARQGGRGGRPPLHRVRLSSFEAVATLVAAGVGVAVMPLRAAQRWQTERTRSLPLTDTWAMRRLLVCTTPHTATLPGVQALAGALLAGPDPAAAQALK